MRMRFRNTPSWVFALVTAICLISMSSAALVKINVDLSSQEMVVEDRGKTFTFPISSARDGYVTPRGRFSAQRLARMHFSKKYHNSPMPHSIFFSGGYAIHGTNATRSLGHPASHGCIRISRKNAATLYAMVLRDGARISIAGSPPKTNRLQAGPTPRRLPIAGLAERQSDPVLAFAPMRNPRHRLSLLQWFSSPTR